MIKIGQFKLTTAFFMWIVAAVVLLFASFIRLEPNDKLLLLPRINPLELEHRTDTSFQVGETSLDRLRLNFSACLQVGDPEDALSEQRYFDTTNCEKIANPGDTVWFRIILENQSQTPLTGITVRDNVRGEIPVTAECWRVDVPLRAQPNPDPGWGGGRPGALYNNGDKAVCIYSHVLADNAEDPLTYTVTTDFTIGDINAANAFIGKQNSSAMRGNSQEDSEALPTGSLAASTFMHINTDFPLTPEIWLPVPGTDNETVINIGIENVGLPIFTMALLFAFFELLLSYLNPEGTNKLLQALVRTAGVFLIFWSFFGHEVFWDNMLGLMFPKALERTGDIELLRPQNSVIGYAADHLELVIVSSLVIIPIGLFIGIFVTREENRDYLPFINNLVNSGQTVPTIAVVAIMAPIIGTGFRPAIIALILYGMLPVVRNTIAGLEGVSPFMKDSALGMGMTPTQVLFSIELPIASAVIMAGIRTSMVINVGTAALGAYVISGGLGDPIAAGLLRQVDPWIVLGAIPAALVAILLDYILGRIEFVLTPRGLQIED